MGDINVRNYVIEALKPLLPKKWKVQSFRNLPDEIIATTVVLSFQSYARNRAAPRGPRLASFVLTIVTPKIVPADAADAIDDDVIDLLNALDQIAGETGMVWTTAEQGEASGRLGFDIALTLPIQFKPVQETP